MNPQKAAFKAAVLSEIGNDMEDMLEVAQKTIVQCEGGQGWLKKAHDGITSISKRVDQQRDSGEMSEDVAKEVKKYLGMTLTSVNDLAAKAAATKLGQEGIASGIQKCIQYTKKKMDTEKLRAEAGLLKQVKAAEAIDPINHTGGPPTNAAAEDLRQRKAEAKAAKEAAAKAAQDAEEPSEDTKVSQKTRSARGEGRKKASKKATKKRSSRAGGTKRSAANS